MTLEELLETIAESSTDEWWHEACWGAHSGPSYRDHLEEESEHLITVKSHSDIAVYKPDISITIAWGLDCMETFKAEWVKKWYDSSASSSFVDVFYNNALVYRERYVTVDGARANLPIPRQKLDATKEKVMALTVPRGRRNFIRLLDSFGRISSFDEYFGDAGFTIVDDEPWP